MKKVFLNKKVILLAKILLFILLVWIFYKQISKISWNEIKNTSILNVGPIVIVFLLLFVNQGLEFLKWSYILKVHKIQIPLITQVKSYLAGNVSGFFTPSYVGNFIGRIMYIERKDRFSISIAILFSNLSQYTVSIAFGLISFFFIKQFMPFTLDEKTIDFILIGLIAFVFVLYFLSLKVIKLIRRWNKIFRFISIHTKINFRDLFFFSLLSQFRYVVFTFQFFILFKAFGIELSTMIYFAIWQLFFISSIMPSLIFGKLVIRETVALLVLSPFIPNSFIILLCALSIWLINNGLSTIISFPFFKFSKD